MDLSIILPIYNEEESIPHLLEEVTTAMVALGKSYEVVLVDDGSKDKSFSILKAAAEKDPHLVVVEFRRNFGQTAALQAGIDHASGDYVVLMDADLQNDPADIGMMIEKLAEGYDLVAGWRADRQDTFINRRLPSIIANWIIGQTTGVKIHDYGCTLKVMRNELAKEIKLYGEMHRFIPVLASLIGAKIIEVKVNHRARQFGETKYGIGRTTRVVLDLITVRFMQKFMVKPMQIFGLAGLASSFIGFFVCLFLAADKLIYGTSLSERPLLLFGVLLIVVGVQLLTLGLVADMLTKTYYESQNKKPYYVRNLVAHKIKANEE